MGAIIDTLNKRKVELKGLNVELGVIDDVKSKYKKLEKLQQIASKKVTRIRSDKAELQGDFSEIFDIVNEGAKEIVKFKKLAMELGVEMPKEIVAYTNAFQNAESDVKAFIKELGI